MEGPSARDTHDVVGEADNEEGIESMVRKLQAKQDRKEEDIRSAQADIRAASTQIQEILRKIEGIDATLATDIGADERKRLEANLAFYRQLLLELSKGLAEAKRGLAEDKRGLALLIEQRRDLQRARLGRDGECLRVPELLRTVESGGSMATLVQQSVALYQSQRRGA